jgi:cation:H+ antiporter
MLWLRLCGGIVLLMVGGDVLVRGSVALARRLGLSPLLIGLTLVGFGTSTPELVASVEAARRGAPAIAIANVIGSNIANTLLILGVAAIFVPIGLARSGFRRDMLTLAALSLLLASFVVWGEIGRSSGVGLVVALIAYTVHAYVSEKTPSRPEDGPEMPAVNHEASGRRGFAMAVAMFAGGVIAVVAGADLLVGGAIALSRQAHVSEAVIGVTLVAVGTSLPELITSIAAALRGHGDVAYGNVVGSNVFNVLGITGLTATVNPISVPAELASLDVWVMVGSVAALAAIGLAFRRIGRVSGLLFVLLYGFYVLTVLNRMAAPPL